MSSSTLALRLATEPVVVFTIEQIADTAVGIADRAGLHALTLAGLREPERGRQVEARRALHGRSVLQLA